MAESTRLRAEVAGEAIIVTKPGTALRVVYRKLRHEPGLIAFDMRGDREASISLPQFLAGAWKLANDKARELGWIV